jgi:hypothetical protein
MKTILQHKHLRRNFLLLIGALLIIIVLIRAFLLPIFEPTIAPITNQTIVVANDTIPQIPAPVTNQTIVVAKDPLWFTIISRLLDSLFVSLTVTVLIGLFLFYIELPDDEKKFEIIESFKISEVFEKERSETKIWYFSGGTGRYTRTVTIPELSKKARNTNSHKTIKMQIIDPNNDNACLNYSNYRNSLKSASNGAKWTPKKVKIESISTIISAVIYKSNNALLDISICLKESFSTLRIDLSSNSGILTKEDQLEPALVCRSNSFLYRTYEEEILQTFKEYPAIDTTKNFIVDMANLTVADITEIATQLNINGGLVDADYTAILQLLKENKNPYA